MSHTVLLVDDDQNTLYGLARALRHQPYQLYTARSGNEAIEILKAHAVGLVVSDEQMPGMSGGALLAWIANHYPEVVRIVLTGHATADAAIRAINEGAVHQFLTKPCDEVRLAITIGKALEHRDLLISNQRLLEQHKLRSAELDRLREDLRLLADILSDEIQRPLRGMSPDTLSEERPHQKGTWLDTSVRDALAGAERAESLVFAMLPRE